MSRNHSVIWTATFWRAVFERSLAAFATTLCSTLAGDATDLLHTTWRTNISVAAMSGLLMALSCVAGAAVGTPGPGWGGAESISSGEGADKGDAQH
ncbi:holin [Streptomyces sp. NPDC001404]|uniref:holin n=1 Tax=Streptomyces sp. NPDC001404 TaxID=3364571 RepID=UPI0036C2F311